MPKLNTATLPSGRTVKFRAPTALDIYRIQQILPSGIELGDSKPNAKALTTADSYRLAINTICLLSVEPHFWADMRPQEDIDAKPLACPAGRTEFDLDMADFGAVFEAMQRAQQESVEAVRPLSATATP